MFPVTNPSSKMPMPALAVEAVVAEIDVERRAEFAGAVSEIAIGASFRTTSPHFIKAFERLHASQEYSLCIADRAGDNVRAVMHSVREVHIEHARRTEHHGVARGLPTGGVASGVVTSAVRLYLGDAATTRPHDEELAK
jgi:hypothetical protein